MQLTTLSIYAAALISTALAMPHIAGPYHGAHIPYRLQTNTTSAQNATTTGTGPKAPLTTGTPKNGTHAPVVHHAMDHVNVNHCHELCSLQSQTCSLAVPDDDKFCWSVYQRCTEKCHEENFRRI
ncbi:unnamed protein product [Penicillium salamii]|uniref:Uncharacterized protein n=1 Tax=Penicillium salamii TaxID=1612424 RepID=A0A9W4NTJ0_9EURO|nr:unnamed protein product [Penicillium salamii]CAG8099340.1 unnamed protein product [Penicillium salamii]CAG8100033.1 unnamed protein product [Penicillium salamii]CAG8103605.1 unnamed protein product [Penicillium salamii]CAG8170653.1 unnamed protein product [Penicillium salamii]